MPPTMWRARLAASSVGWCAGCTLMCSMLSPPLPGSCCPCRHSQQTQEIVSTTGVNLKPAHAGGGATSAMIKTPGEAALPCDTAYTRQ